MPIPPLFVKLVDDTSLLLPRASQPPMKSVLARYLASRGAPYGALSGQLVCPVSRLAELVSELVQLEPERPVEISLVVDTGLGSVPKALSMVLSRPALLTPSTVETAAPPDVDATWLDRVSEFVPEDVTAVVEPRRPLDGERGPWLDAVRRVAEHGCTPKLRCGGPRRSDTPSVDEVAEFVDVAGDGGQGFVTSLGLRHVIRQTDGGNGQATHGILNLLVAAARALTSGDVKGALASTEGPKLAAEARKLSDADATAVRGLLPRCGSGPVPEPAAELAGLGLI
jgi:hypothetical protein